MWQDAGNAAAVIRTEKKTAVRLPADVASCGGCMRRGVCAVRVYGGICLESGCGRTAWCLPFQILGLERLIRDNRPGLYYVSLAVCILSNYYISIMICIFLVLWFLLYWMEQRASGYRAWIRCVVFAACGSHRRSADPLSSDGKGALLKRCIRNIVPGDDGWYFNIVSELARSLLAVDVYTGDSHWPNLYCGIFALFLLFLYVWNRAVPWKKKLPRLALVVFFWLSFSKYAGFYLAWPSFPDIASGERQSFCTRFWYL